MPRLGDLCDILNGYAFKSEKYVNSGIRIIRIANVQKGYIEDSAPVFYPLDNNEYKKYELTEGDLLLSLTGNVGRVALLQKEFLPAALNQRVACLRIKDETTLNKSFLFNFLNSDYFENKCIESAKGVAQKNMSTEWLKDYEMPLFSMETQKKISNELDQISNLISLRKQQLSKLDELVKSRFIELFGDPNIEFKYDSHKFKEFASDMTKGPFGSDMKKDLFVPKGEDTYKVYIQANAIQGDQNIGDYYISKEYFDSKIFRFEVHPGDYIITCDGTLGKYLKLNDEMEKGVISPSLLRLTLNEEKMTSEYFEYLWDMYMLLLMKKEARNACLVHLPSAKVIGEMDIPVPPFAMQKEFSRFVEQTDKSKFEIQKSLEKLETLKKALMQKYFG